MAVWRSDWGYNCSWCEVMQPNYEVREGTFKQSEFAADLAQVAAGTSKLSEYQNATEFFERTYLTAGLRRLLMEALSRLVYGDGEPMIEVKTSFGGGKTHSMMALYHLFNRKYRIERVDAAIQSLFLDLQIRELPRDIRIAVVVGTDMNVERARDIPEIEGAKVHTLMGEICLQLARAADNIALYKELIQLNDERCSSPGVKDLREFLDGCGACLILLDELVNYGKKLYRGGNVEGGDFDSFIVFLQELSEAVRTSERSMLVASLPQSDIEIGEGDGGREVLRTIEHHFGRLQAVWSPVESQESFEIVRRRLFEPCRREKLRDEICGSFVAMYNRDRKTPKNFPNETREARYAERLKACYPIHPQLFDLLYEKWATIETFQKTRGVLRLMAGLVHKLWLAHDPNPMIMAGSMTLYDSAVREELLRYIPSNWAAIVSTEIDGENSAAYKLELDKSKTASQLQIGRRLTRTIFMGSAPTARGQNVRGLTKEEIMLGVIMPQDKGNFSTFKDTLGKLTSRLTYLYSSETHYWFDGRPTLRKVAELLEAGIEERDIEFDIIDLLRAEFRAGRYFNTVYVTDDPEEISDDTTVRLVILPPSAPFKRRSGKPDDESKALIAATNILNNLREGTPRRNKNMLIFLAADEAGIDSLKKLQRRYRAWNELYKERESRNLDLKQIEEVEKNRSDLRGQVRTQLSMAYIYGLRPTAPPDDMKRIEWRETQLKLEGTDNIRRLCEALMSTDSMIKELKPLTLEAELEKHLFRISERVTVGELWEYCKQYVYAPRLYNYDVLSLAIVEGVRDGYFGFAEYFDEETNEYTDLVMNDTIKITSFDQYLVRRDAATDWLKKLAAQSAAESESAAAVDNVSTADNVSVVDNVSAIETVPEIKKERLPTVFSLTVDLDVDSAARDVKQCMDNLVDVLLDLKYSSLTLKFSANVIVPEGIPSEVRDAIEENNQQMNLKSKRRITFN